MNYYCINSAKKLHKNKKDNLYIFKTYKVHIKSNVRLKNLMAILIVKFLAVDPVRHC